MSFKSSLLSLLSLASASMAANHDIKVGPNLTFSPNVTTAAARDTITFKFYPGVHDVAQGPYDSPCTPLTNGFYSGFIAPEAGEANETFVVTVNDTNPIWFYCSERMHCQLGMAGVINPPASGDTLAAYVAAAKKTTNSTTPAAVAGGVIAPNPDASTPSPTSAAPSATSPSSTASVSPTQSTSEGVVSGGKNLVLHGLSAGVAVLAFWYGMV